MFTVDSQALSVFELRNSLIIKVNNKNKKFLLFLAGAPKSLSVLLFTLFTRIQLIHFQCFTRKQ